MKKMNDKIWQAIQTYQIPGCVNETPGKDNIVQKGVGVEWSEHVAGTLIMPVVGTIFLGMPKGFNRLGIYDGNNEEQMKINIFETFKQMKELTQYGFDWLNVPVWKYLDEHGSTLIRGLYPRKNRPFLYIILEDCRDQIDCYEVTESDLEKID